MIAAQFQLAEQSFHKGDLDRADQICVEVLNMDPRHAPANLLSGLVAARKGQGPVAIERLKRALELSRDDYVATTWLQVALRKESRFAEAIEVGEKARALWPKDPEVLVSLSHAYLGARDIQKAAECLAEAVATKPNDASLHRRLGIAYELLGRDSDAVAEFQKTIDLAPLVEDGYVRLGRLFLAHGNSTQVVEFCKSALKVLPKSAQIHLIYAQALRNVHDNEPAYTALQTAIELDPEIVISAAMWLHEDGNFEEAAKLLQRSIDLKPMQGVAYFELIKGKKISEADRDLLMHLEELLRLPSLPPKETAALHYGLGKASNDLHEYQKAMAHFDEGNRLNYEIHLSGNRFDLSRLEANRMKIISMFTPEFFERNSSARSDSKVPIFVVGMIRSGTTLVEQILSSHPEVGAAGEQRFWVNEIPHVVDLDSQTLDVAKFTELRDRYVQVLRTFQPDTPRVTDKMPMNFYCAGLIHLAYPNSPIIHIQRNPVDTALSIYMTDLAKPPEFAHNKRNIVEQYRDYQKLMDHWRAVIPASSLFEVRYEDLVSEQEHWTRRMLAFCGLEWDPGCLDFHSNERQVSTPSMWQVRQPIYRTSIEKWRNFEPWLGEFAELLDTSPATFQNPLS